MIKCASRLSYNTVSKAYGCSDEYVQLQDGVSGDNKAGTLRDIHSSDESGSTKHGR
ncbi:hypothetical protein PISMIDRAFT_218081 [Pisolithus microcarpus 441]|uniref:Unplaced genomic scaffold scaffold_14, whole genome shotgun sequence n=1 Tax=Pisolithus microcarpus 441 TaxID=765257 RepID=A0A0C9ZCP2_9AGAM|nr:hypothetical protein PISMIDRAFT_218081 [Pisolithus microcarpus 441]